MKKLVLTTMALVAGASFVHAQGLVSMQEGTKNTAELATNGIAGTAGTVSGVGYEFELLDMTSTGWGALTVQQQAAADNLGANPSDLSLWTDSGISGSAGQGLSVGEINAVGAAPGATAANWTAPSTTAYTSGGLDYYIIVGWSTALGTSWLSVSNALPTATVGWFGETAVYNNYAGGGPDSDPVVNVLATGGNTTGVAGTGTPSGDAAGILLLDPVPEPTTLALAGLGGLSMLFLRRRK